ncbi:hypothetical protein RB195_023008 [Necator americanus]|uniref:Peptidase A2 domain-containing protein n=1 Tax=Necator americanus TaxID=51031 RepID=A0ABR1EHF4_NECAM
MAMFVLVPLARWRTQTTLKELAAEVQHFLDIRQDNALLERSSLPPVNVVESRRSRNQRMPRPQTLWTQARILQKFPGEEEAEICQQRLIASTHAGVAVNRIYHRVQIDGKTVRSRLDTGADVTLAQQTGLP